MVINDKRISVVIRVYQFSVSGELFVQTNGKENRVEVDDQ